MAAKRQDFSHLPQQDFEGLPLVGVMGTLYKDPKGVDAVRFRLALTNAENYQTTGLPLVVVDATPEDSEAASILRPALRERGAIVFSALRPGLATQQMDGVDFAVTYCGAERVVRHEPEKVGMITFADRIVEALGSVDALVIGRTEVGMKTLPPIQAQTERLAGWLLKQHLDFPPDALSGGRAYTARGAQHLIEYDFERHGNNWLYLYHSVLSARAAGLPIGGIQVDLIHPPEMTEKETGNPTFDTKRYRQFFLQLDNLLQVAGYEK